MNKTNLYSVDVYTFLLDNLDNEALAEQILDNFEKNNYANDPKADDLHYGAIEDCSLEVTPEVMKLANTIWFAARDIIVKEYPDKLFNMVLDVDPKAYAIWGHVIRPNEQTIYHSHHETNNTKYLNLSAVYYVKFPENSGDLVFNPFTHKNMWTKNIKPQDGMLVIFPSWLHHWTLKNRSNENRISISANLIITEKDE
jgi:hypothetical protein